MPRPLTLLEKSLIDSEFSPTSEPGIDPSELRLLPESLRRELEIYIALKPYLAHCLGMNHDLNNPLAGIIGYSELMIEDSDTPPEIRRQLEQILKCALRISYFVDCLCLEKIELSEKVDLKSLEKHFRPLAISLEEGLEKHLK